MSEADIASLTNRDFFLVKKTDKVRKMMKRLPSPVVTDQHDEDHTIDRYEAAESNSAFHVFINDPELFTLLTGEPKHTLDKILDQRRKVTALNAKIANNDFISNIQNLTDILEQSEQNMTKQSRTMLISLAGTTKQKNLSANFGNFIATEKSIMDRKAERIANQHISAKKDPLLTTDNIDFLIKALFGAEERTPITISQSTGDWISRADRDYVYAEEHGVVGKDAPEISVTNGLLRLQWNTSGKPRTNWFDLNRSGLKLMFAYLLETNLPLAEQLFVELASKKGILTAILNTMELSQEGLITITNRRIDKKRDILLSVDNIDELIRDIYLGSWKSIQIPTDLTARINGAVNLGYYALLDKNDSADNFHLDMEADTAGTVLNRRTHDLSMLGMKQLLADLLEIDLILAQELFILLAEGRSLYTPGQLQTTAETTREHFSGILAHGLGVVTGQPVQSVEYGRPVNVIDKRHRAKAPLDHLELALVDLDELQNRDYVAGETTDALSTTEIQEMVAIAERVAPGLSKPMLPQNYTLLMYGDFYKDDAELERDILNFGSRVNLKSINPGEPQTVVTRILEIVGDSEGQINPNTVMVQLPEEFSLQKNKEHLETLLNADNAKGIRFMIINTEGIRDVDDETESLANHKQIYAMMKLARQITARDVLVETDIYHSLRNFMNFFTEDVDNRGNVIYDYIQNLSTDELMATVKTIIYWRKPERIEAPDIDLVAAALIRA